MGRGPKKGHSEKAGARCTYYGVLVLWFFYLTVDLPQLVTFSSSF